MHSDHDLEKEVRYNLRGIHLQKPPQEMLNTFEEQVWGRITTNPRPALPGFLLAAPMLVLFVLLAGYGLWLLKQPLLPAPVQTQKAISTPTSAPITESVKPSDLASTNQIISGADSETVITDEKLDQRIRDLLVLEWLGEADGLLDDLNQMPGITETALPKAI